MNPMIADYYYCPTCCALFHTNADHVAARSFIRHGCGTVGFHMATVRCRRPESATARRMALGVAD